MTLAEIPTGRLAEKMRGNGIALRTGPFIFRVRSVFADVIEDFQRLYGRQPEVTDEFVDYRVSVGPPRGLRRWIRPQAIFRFDRSTPFKPLPRAQALPMLEWGMNWVIASHAHQYLILHAASVEKDGRAAILPGPPGSGKSTLCAALVNRGWRLLSDELTLIDPADGSLLALARPVNLKNESIAIIRDFAGDATLSRPAHDTVKGTVALLKPPGDSVARMDDRATPAWVVLPEFQRGATADLAPRSRADTFIDLGRNAFNYSIHGGTGFRTLARIIDCCGCFRFRYSRLDDAVAAFDRLAAEGDAATHHDRSANSA